MLEIRISFFALQLPSLLKLSVVKSTFYLIRAGLKIHQWKFIWDEVTKL